MADEEKYFDRQQAEQLLPTIAALLETAREQKRTMETLDQEFSQVQNRILLMGGLVPPYPLLAEKRAEHDAAVKKTREALAEIEKLGCLVKDLEIGLVDFPMRRDNETVYLCWKLGEERIGYWHGVEEGFAGRKPLDAGLASGSGKPN